MGCGLARGAVWLSTMTALSYVVGCASAKKKMHDAASRTEDKPPTTVTAVHQEPNQPLVLDPNSNLQPILWKRYPKDMLPDLEHRIEPAKFQIWKCDYDAYVKGLEGDSMIIMLPTQHGLTVFVATNSGTMSPELAKKFPHLKTLRGKTPTGNLSLRMDMNEEGIFAEFKGEGNSWYLAPYLNGSRIYYVLYEETEMAPVPRDTSFR